jgi:hypothetical protein
MKALIFYEDIVGAANTRAILNRVAHRADIAVKWDISPWRLGLLEFQRTAELALRDATDAHLIVFTNRFAAGLSAELTEWLEKWATLRHVPDAAIAIIGDGTSKASSAPATSELSQFTRRHGLSFIFSNHGTASDESSPILPGYFHTQASDSSAPPSPN